MEQVMEIDVPQDYDWRQIYPQCVQPASNTGKDCSASFAFATLGGVQDRICMSTNQTLQLSVQEIIDCDENQFGCDGGLVNKVLTWGKKKGFITEDCMEYAGKKNECDIEHFEINTCRVENHVYKVNDFCIAF